MTTSTVPKRPFRSVIPSQRRLLCLTTGLLALGITAIASAQDSDRARNGDAGKAGVRSYDIRLMTDNASFSQPTNQWLYYFKIWPSVKLTGDAYVDLDYEYSQTIRTDSGSITVMLNDKPVASRTIGSSKVRNGNWHVELPIDEVKDGYNTLKIVTRQFSSDGPCKDVDNLSNWIKFGKDCKLHLERVDPYTFPLYAYPYPFLDTLAENAVQSTWVIPSSPKPTFVAEALGLASDWGRWEPARGLPIKISEGQPHAGHNIMIGAPSGWNGGDTQNLGENQGMISVTPGPVPGASRLNLSGTSDQGLRQARKTLAYPEMVEQLRGRMIPVVSPPADEAQIATTRLGTFTFTDLGTPAIRLGGAFRQLATLTIQRPVRCDLGRDSFIKIRFRHSANLNPLRSTLNIYVNGLPSGSAKLDADNTNGGILTARIPVNELAKNLWQVDIVAYHDLASIDCSKSYDNIAWTMIEGDSTFELSTGLLGGRPFLDAFPYLVGRDGLAPKRCTIAFPENPSNAALSAGATVAARAAQMNRHSFDWDVSYGGQPQSVNSSIAIGYYNEVQRFSGVAKALLVAPQGNGAFKINPQLRLLPSALNGGAVLQAVRSPWSDSAVYYVLLAADDAALNRFVKFLGDPKRAVQLTGEVAVLTSDGELITLDTVNDTQARKNITDEANRYTPYMTGIAVVVFLALLITAYLVARQFVKRNPTIA